MSAQVALAALNFNDADQIPDWARDAISTLAEEEILSGNSDGSFAPDRSLNRAEFAKIMVKATGVDEFVPLHSSFPDVKVTDWFFRYVETARYHGWLSGYPDGTFRPGNKINRAEVAKIVANAFGLEIPTLEEGAEWFQPYFEVLEVNNLLAHDSTWEELEASHEPSRAEISEQIFRIRSFVGETISEETAPVVTPTATTPPSRSRTSAPAAPVASELPQFEYTETKPFADVRVAQNAATLLIEKLPTLAKEISVRKNQQGVTALAFKLRTEQGIVEVTGFQFRLIGNMLYSDFSDMWLEYNGKAITDKVRPTENTITLPLKQTTLAIGTNLKTLTLKGDMSQTAKSGNSGRWVLFLPEWIGANTDKKVGFFPLGGSDITVQ